MDHIQQEHPPEQGASKKGAALDSAASHRMRDHLKAYQDGELPSLRRWWVGKHVGKCAVCQTEIAAMQRLARDMQALERATPRPQLRARILASLPDAPPVQSIQATASRPIYSASARSGFGRARRPMLAMGGACAALLLLMAGAFALNHWQRLARGAGSGYAPTVIAPPSNSMSTPENLLARNGGGTSGAAQSVEPAHAPLDPFSPADSAAASEAPSSTYPPASGKTENTSNSSSRQTASPALASTVNGEAYTDPTSRTAEELAARALPEKLEAERHLAAAPELQPAHFVPKSPGSIQGVGGSAQIAFVVTDVSAARREVQKWAEEAGAKVTAFPIRSADNASRVEAPNGVPNASGVGTGPGNMPLSPSATLLKIQIPAEQADVFKSRLNQIGTLPLSIGKPYETLPHIAKIQETGEDAIAMPAPRAGKAGQYAPKATVTILLRLQPGGNLH